MSSASFANPPQAAAAVSMWSMGAMVHGPCTKLNRQLRCALHTARVDETMVRVLDAIRRQHPKQEGRELSWLSASLEVSIQVVNNWTTRGLPADRYVAVADALGWSIDALVGRAPPPPPTTWPFELVKRERFDRLTAVQKGVVESSMLDALERLDSLKDTEERPAVDSRKRRAGGH